MAYTQVKTPIVYYGGKTSILNHILPLIPRHEVYTETFFGGGTVFWAKDPAKNETINDRLDIVVNFYRVLRTNFAKLKVLIDATLISRTIYNEAGVIIRSHMKGNKVDRIQLAWAFWMHSNFSHMHKICGGYKQQKDGGKSIAKELQTKKNKFTDSLVARIENAVIENEHWMKVADARDSNQCFHYLDPPYPGTDQGKHHKFNWEDFEQLLTWCTACNGKFMLSNYNSPLLDQFIESNGWYKREIIHELKAARKGGTQTHKVEVLAMNYNPEHTLSLF